jgi:hypothetical protein
MERRPLLHNFDCVIIQPGSNTTNINKLWSDQLVQVLMSVYIYTYIYINV